MRSSTMSGSLTPPRAKILMPLSGAALCDAEIITPKSASRSATRNARAGVGMTPASRTSTPEEASPAATAASRKCPETRGSRATGQWPLALRVLRRLAGLLETGLLALLHAGVAREEAGLLQGRTVVLDVDAVEGAGDAEAQCTGLARVAATGDAGDDVVRADE